MSKTSWVFNSGDSADQLVKKICQETGVDTFDLAVVLGSGWGNAAQFGEPLVSVEYRDWSCFPAGQIAGHSGTLSAVKYASWNILFFSGRFHCYQGLSAFDASFPVRLASALGCPRVLLTCATGGINRQMNPGDFMLVDDHINLLGDNPLRGLAGDIFVDMADAYQDDVYAELLANDLNELTVHRGVLAAMHGPSYETPAEIKFLQRAGVDVVSMSTVHEVIMARYLEIQVAAVAFVANHAAGVTSASLSHEDVLDCSSKHSHLYPYLVSQIINSWKNVSVSN